MPTTCWTPDTRPAQPVWVTADSARACSLTGLNSTTVPSVGSGLSGDRISFPRAYDAGGRLRWNSVKIAYVFSTSGHTASYKLGKMILPQLEQGTHGVDVVGMFFFDDNTYLLRAGDPLGERLARVAAQRGMLLMLCDQCALERHLADGEIGAAFPRNTVAGVRVGCFPDLYAALAGNPPDHIITL